VGALAADARRGTEAASLQHALVRRLPNLAAKPRVLVCAPSNAAADELLQRVMNDGFADAQVREDSRAALLHRAALCAPGNAAAGELLQRTINSGFAEADHTCLTSSPCSAQPALQSRKSTGAHMCREQRPVSTMVPPRLRSQPATRQPVSCRSA